MPKYQQKPSAIPSGRSHHAMASQAGRYPSRQIEALAVLAHGRNPHALPAFGPAPAHPGMQGEAGLILKDEGRRASWKIVLRNFQLRVLVASGFRGIDHTEDFEKAGENVIMAETRA
jgi:hypothetical protein